MISTADLYIEARRYYAAWAAVDPTVLDQPGGTFVISPHRDGPESGAQPE